MEPLVSIITPCFNGETYVRRYMESILNQSYPNIELIFVNDGSTDTTEEVVLSYVDKMNNKGIKFIYLKQENQGQAAALNLGLKYFTGDYLTWPDSDDEISSDCIEKKVAFLEKNLHFALCICKSLIVEDNEFMTEKGIFQRVCPEDEDTFFEDMIFLKNVFFTPGAYMVRSKDFLTVVPERDIYTGRGGQNAQMLLPMLYKYKCGYLDDVLCTYYIRENSHSHSIDDSKKIINQITLYENILLETLKRIDQSVLEKYEYKIKCHYGKQRFGNALDSQDKRLIKREYARIKELKCGTLKDLLLYIKNII